MIVKLWDKKEKINGQEPEVVKQSHPWTEYTDTIIVQSGATTLYIDNIDIIRHMLALDNDAKVETVLEKYKEFLEANQQPQASAQEQINSLREENERLKAENADIIFALMDGGLI